MQVPRRHEGLLESTRDVLLYKEIGGRLLLPEPLPGALTTTGSPARLPLHTRGDTMMKPLLIGFGVLLALYVVGMAIATLFVN